MGKNKKNKGSNKPAIQPTVKSEAVTQQPTVVPSVASDIQAERERHLEAGKAAGEAEKAKIIAKATEEAEAIKKSALAEAETQKSQILAETQKAKTEAYAAKEAVERDRLALEEDRQTYKAQVLAEHTAHLKALESENAELARANKRISRELQLSNADKDALETEIDESNEFRAENIHLKSELSALSSDNKTLSELKEELEKKLNEVTSKLIKFGDDPERLNSKIQELEKENAELSDRIAQFPTSTAELALLRDRSQKYSQLENEKAKLFNDCQVLEDRAKTAEIKLSDIAVKQANIKTLELQRDELTAEVQMLQDELSRITAQYEKRDVKVFAGLSKIDDAQTEYPSYSPCGIKDLKQLCADFRNWLAGSSEHRLYYSDTHIRTFIAGLAASRLIILQGMSGTGKSSLPRSFGEFIGSRETTTKMIPVQSSWKDRNDLLGFYNDFEKRYKETKFLKELYNAISDQDNIHIIMLDEMNLSRIEYYFADFLSVLEDPNPNNWEINLVSDAVQGDKTTNLIRDGVLHLTENVWFVGTANNDDSTATITDKVYDRAIVLDFQKRMKAFKPETSVRPIKLGFAEFKNLLDKAVKQSDDAKIENIIEDLDEQMSSSFKISFGNRIGEQIKRFSAAFVACGGSREEAIDVVFATKVLRKIQGYDADTKYNLERLQDHIKATHPDFKSSIGSIDDLKRRI